jgi:3-hydroxyisobutyrate dehydrogenase-like beta-hydroxyacid dehydrogenase
MVNRQKVSVIGLGLMGSAVARRLVAAGHEVTVWNRTLSKGEALAVAGATAAHDLVEAIAASPVSIWCLLNYQLMAELMSDEAVIEVLEGRTVIPSATGGPDDVDLVAQVLTSAGATMLDAKIMFFPAQVGADDAELLLSGSEQAAATYQDLLADVAGICRYLGTDFTSAAVLYTAVWAYDFAARFAYMEGAALAVASGLDFGEFERSAALRTARFAEQNEEFNGRVARNDFDGDQATVSVYKEGIASMLGAFSNVDVKADLLEAVGMYSAAAERAGHGRKDISVIFTMLRGQTS